MAENQPSRKQTGMTLMLLPDFRYRNARPKVKDAHLTVAFFGRTTDQGLNLPFTVRNLHNLVDNLAAGLDPIPAKANGVGVFDAGGDGFALVDLIDGVGVSEFRCTVSNTAREWADRAMIPVMVDTHGFTPHMTRRYLDPEDEFYAQIGPELIDNVEFTFEAVGIWIGEERYEVSL